DHDFKFERLVRKRCRNRGSHTKNRAAPRARVGNVRVRRSCAHRTDYAGRLTRVVGWVAVLRRGSGTVVAGRICGGTWNATGGFLFAQLLVRCGGRSPRILPELVS